MTWILLYNKYFILCSLSLFIFIFYVSMVNDLNSLLSEAPCVGELNGSFVIIVH